MFNMTIFNRIIVVLAFLAGSLSISGCGSGNSGGGGGGNNQPIVTSITLSCSPTAILSTATSTCQPTITETNTLAGVTYSVSPTAIGSVSTSGVFTPSSSSSSGTATVQACSAQAGFGSICGTATVTVTVPQTVSWNVSSLTVNAPNGKIRVDGTVLSSTCTDTEFTFVSKSSDSSVHFGGTVLPTWQPDSTGAKTGYILAPTVLPQDKNPGYTAVPYCAGTSPLVSASAINLTAVIVAPDAPSVSPNTAKATSNTTYTLTSALGTYMAGNDYSSASGWRGTEAVLDYTCNSTGYGDTTFVNINSVQLGVSQSNVSTGSRCMIVHTDSDINGVGGGTASTPSASTITMVVGAPIGQNAFVQTTFGNATTAGTILLSQNGQQNTYQLGNGAQTPVYNSAANAVYVPNKLSHSVSVLDLQTKTVSTIDLGAQNAPIFVALASDGSQIVYAEHSDDFHSGRFLKISPNGAVSVIRENVNMATSMVVTASNQVRWTTNASSSKPGEIQGFDLNASSDMPVQYLSRSVDSLNQLEDGSFAAFNTGEKFVISLDPQAFTEEGTSLLPKPIWGMSKNTVWMADTTDSADAVVGSLSTSVASGKRAVALTQLGFVPKAEASTGVIVQTVSGRKQFVTVQAGSPAPLVRTVPSQQ